MFLLFIYKIWNFLSNLIKKNFDFYFDEKNYIKGIDQMFNSLKKLEKFDDNLPNSFDKDKSMDRILKINDHLNKKYALYFKLLRNLNNNEINLTINIDKVFDEIQKKKKKNSLCSEIFLNIENKKCDDLLINVLKEKGYGKYSKELFENDENFIIFDKLDNNRSLNFGNMNLIILILNKLKFKIKLIYIKNLVNKIDEYGVYLVNSNPNKIYHLNENIPNYIKYYEKFENWELHQNISKKLNNQPHLRLYLNSCIDIINRRISYLNPNYSNFKNLTDIIFMEDKLKDGYKKLIDLINKSQKIELDKILNMLNSQRNNLNNLIPKNYKLINNNYTNNLDFIIMLLNTPTKYNLNIVINILNSSYKFHKSLFEF